MQGNRAPQNIFNIGLISCRMLSRCSLKQASQMWSEVIFFFCKQKEKILFCVTASENRCSNSLLHYLVHRVCTIFFKIGFITQKVRSKKNIYSTQLQINHTYLELHLSLVVFLKSRGDLIY